MDTRSLKKFAQAARKQLVDQVTSRLQLVLQEGSLARRESGGVVAQLEQRIHDTSKSQVIEEVAYTWFNRFCALRFMDANQYTRIGAVSPGEGFVQPELLMEAKQGLIDEDLKVDRNHVLGLLDGTQPSSEPQQEAYRLLLVAVCNHYHHVMPFLFEEIADYSELLIPDDLLSDGSILTTAREALTPEACQDVEVIGWLYQFYISEKKDDVFAALKKGKKITPENIPAATQLFTPHWIVRYLVENSLGRLWMLNFPQSKLVEQMEYYIAPEPEAVASGQGLVASERSRGDSSELQGSDCVAESHGVGYGRVQGDEGISEGGTLRADESGQAGSGFDSVEHRGGTGQKGDGGISQLSINRAGKSGGSGNSASNRTQPELFGSDDSGPANVNAQRDRQDAQQPHSKTSHQPLATDHLRISSPEEIRICDPACGSGHMLTYAFDLLYAIYEEQGYQATDIPRLILTHNLYGIEIDQRAGALAAFALTMKAREKYRRFLTGGKVVQPNICVLENIQIDPEDLSAYMDKVGRDLFSGGLQGVVNQWEEADNFGSLIRPLVTDVSEVLELLRERQMGEDLFLAGVHQKVLKALRQADYLSPKYHVVVANPPYMGTKSMNPVLRKFALKNFPLSKNDFFAMFLERAQETAFSQGYAALVTMQSWMFLSSYEQLRRKLLGESTLQCLLHMDNMVMGIAFGTAASVWCKKAQARARTHCIYVTVQDLGQGDIPSEFPVQNDRLGWVSPQAFARIPGSPISYWASEPALRAFDNGTPLGDIAKPRQGLATADNDTFRRNWYEVGISKIGFGGYSDTKKWFPYNSGGAYRKWYGNQLYVVNWESDGKDIREDKLKKLELGLCIPGNSKPWNTEYYFRESISWSKVTSGKFSVRYFPAGFIFDVAGCSIFQRDARIIYYLIGLLNSVVSDPLLGSMSATLNFEVGQIKAIPVLDSPQSIVKEKEILDAVAECIDAGRVDWNAFETSWEFAATPLLVDGVTVLRSRYGDYTSECKKEIARQQLSEETINAQFIDKYGFGDTLSADLNAEQIALSVNPPYRYGSDKSDSELEALLLADTMREFISYAVGCMLGRYSLDKPGLILANQGETADDYRQQIPEPTFAPDEDNVIPLLDGDWFTDDISERFKEFLKVTFGTEHYEENLTFLENALYPDNLTGKKRKTIRDYFLKEFYNHHIKLYKKRPIYWLFSSPKGTFNALIYMHRYRPDTVSTVLGYLRDFNAKLNASIDSLQSTADSADASAAQKTKALKDIVQLKKQVRELGDYERDVLYPLATERLEIDLDDGVKSNYPKFGNALKRIPGL